MTNEAEKETVKAFVREMNDAWTRDNGERLSEYFHPRMVAITPVDALRCKGAAECISGWRSFSENSRIHAWREDDIDIEVFGDTAIVTYYYVMDVTLASKRQSLRGRDMLVLRKEQNRWWLIADQFSPYP
jgi:ketosteroid isomerase-like protein